MMPQGVLYPWGESSCCELGAPDEWPIGGGEPGHHCHSFAAMCDIECPCASNPELTTSPEAFPITELWETFL